MLLVLYCYLKLAVSALIFNLNWDLRQQDETCYLFIFESNVQKADFFLSVTVGANGPVDTGGFVF